MSKKSIASKLQGLEQKLSAVNGNKKIDDPLSSSNHTMGTSVGSHKCPPRRPKLMSGSSRSRPSLALSLPPSLPSPPQDTETEARLRDLRLRQLTIRGSSYPPDVTHLELLGELGNGTCGHVVKMRHKPSGEIIAVKQMRRSGNSEENKRILMDLDVVLQSQCPYIVRCYGCFVTEADVWICMELMASCFDKILKRLGGPVPEDILGKVTVSTVKALSYLKEKHDVIHRDVKPSNILVDSTGQIKLCDFGISGRLVDSKAKTRNAGCAAYMAPERIDPPNPQEPDYDIRADVWSLGISLVELATGIFPYRDCQNDFEVLSKVINDEPPMLPENQSFSPEFRSFVKQCLTKDFYHRPKYNALLQHPFLVRSESRGVPVDQWLHSILPRSDLPSRNNTAPQHLNQSRSEEFTTSSPVTTPTQTNRFIGNQSFKLDSPVKSPAKDRGLQDLADSFAQRINLNDSKKSSQESPDQSFSESSKMSCVSIEQNSSVNSSSVSSRISVECGSRTPTERNDDVNKTDSTENIVILMPKHNVECVDGSSSSSRITRSPIDKNIYKIYRNYGDGYNQFNNTGVPIVCNNRNNQVVGTSPKEYFIQQRGRSLSNTMVYEGDVRIPPPPRYVPASPKCYMTRSEIRNQPFSGGGGGPQSLESSYQDDRLITDDLQQPQHHRHAYPQCAYGSPEVNRRQYFSPNRCRLPPTHSNYEYDQRPPRQQDHNVVSPPPTNFVLGEYENVHDGGSRVVSPPCFRNNAPTNYFAMSVLRYGHTVSGEQGCMGFHHNPGGSCSQPASLEAYGDTRHPQYAVNSRWLANTSPIVLQRFYHQQNQRRSRRDLRDGSPTQRSVSREASIGRSPEPPRRAHRDPSTGRTEPSLPMDQQSILERLEKERGRMTPVERERDLHIPERERQPHRYDRETQDCRECENSQSTEPSSIDAPIRDRLEFRPRNEHTSRSGRYHRSCEENGDCRGGEKDDSERDNLTSPKERFEQKLQERRNNKETYVFPRDREKRDESNGDVSQHSKSLSREEANRLSPLVSHKHVKTHHKDKDEQGWLNSIAGIVRKRFTSYYVKLHLGHNAVGGGSENHRIPTSPPHSTSSTPVSTTNNNGRDGHGSTTNRVSRFGGSIPRKVADCDQEIGSGGGHFISSYRYRKGLPPVGTTESWSLPSSPLPARTSS